MIADHDPDNAEPISAPYEPFAEAAPMLRRPRKRRSAAGRMALSAAAILVTFVLVAAGAGFLYVGHSPISLESWQPAIAASLQSRLSPGFKVELGPTAIQRGPHGVGIGFAGLTVRDPRGRTVIDAPGGRIGLDALALVSMQIKVRRLELDGIQLALRVGADGKLSLSAGAEDAAPIDLGPSPAGPGVANFGGLIATLAKAMAGEDQSLDHVAIVDGRLTVLNAGRTDAAVYDGLKLAFDRSGQTARASLAAHGPSGDWSVDARAQYGTEARLAVQARQLAVDDFLRLDPHPPAFAFDSPVSFRFDATASPAGALSALDGEFSLGAGKFDPHDPDGAPPTAIDEATGKVTLDGQGRYALDAVEILAGASHVRFAGVVAPPVGADPLWRTHLHSADIVFAAARPGLPSAKLDDVDFDGHFDPAVATFETDRFTARGPHLNGNFGVRLRLSPDGPALKLDLGGTGAILEALRLWPIYVNPDARKWCDENIRGGELASGSLKIDWDAAALAAVLKKQAPPAESVAGHFTVRDTAVDLLPGLPTTTGLDASGTITGRYFHTEAVHGTMDLGEGRKLFGANLSFTVPDTKPVPRMPAEGYGRISGSADALAALLARDTMKPYVGVALKPETIKGQFQGELKLALTLGRGVRPEEQKFTATGSLADLAVDKFLGDARLDQGALDFTATREGVKMTGTGTVFGALARLDLAKAGTDVGALTLTSTLDEAARAKLGFDSGPRLRGPVTLKLKAPLDKTGADVDVDLAKASLDSLGGPPWKAAGKPGHATFSLKAAGDNVAVNNITLDSGPLSARGQALFGPGGALKNLKLSSLRLNPGDDLKLEIEGGAPNKVTLRGGTLDARGIVKGLTGGGGAKDASDVDLDVKVANAIGANKEKLSGLELTARRRNGGFVAMEARGRFARGAFTARTADSGSIVIRSEDAGALARFLDLYTKLDGGTIDLTVRETGDTARGQATIKKFMVHDEPALRQLQASAPPPTAPSRGAPQNAGGEAPAPARFERLTASFTRTGGRLEVRDGVVANSTFGLTTQGHIDFTADRLDLNGVYVPMYQFNNALGGIPVLGALLTGGRDEGVFAINYRATGPASGPSLTVNPLSGMTPGFLRKMFGAFDGTTPTPAPDEQAPSSFTTTR